MRMAGTGPLRWSKPWEIELLGVKVRVWEEGCGNSQVDLRDLSLLPDSLGSFKDDVLLVEMRTSLNNTSVCALEPSGCIPLPSIVSTVRTKEPSSRSFQPINCVSYSSILTHSIPPCPGIALPGPVLLLGWVVGRVHAHVALTLSQWPFKSPRSFGQTTLLHCSTLHAAPGDSLPPPPLTWQRAARLGEQLLQDLRSGQCMQVSKLTDLP